MKDGQRAEHDGARGVVGHLARSARRGWREETEGFVSVSMQTGVSELRGEPRVQGHVHDCGEIMHVAVVRGVTHVLAWGVETVDLLLERGVCLGMREDAVEDARDRARAGVRTCHHRENAVIEEMALGRGLLPGKVFVVLSFADHEIATLPIHRPRDDARTK